MNNNPFDRVNLGYDGLFGSRTMFYHLQPARGGESLMQSIRVPVLDFHGSKMKWLESATILSVMLGFLWTCIGLYSVALGSLKRQKAQPRKRD